MQNQRSSAPVLAAIFTLLVCYASLYPFTDWRDQGLVPWAFVSAPWPRYLDGFDIWMNLAGYMPLGFLIALAAMRTDWLSGMRLLAGRNTKWQVLATSFIVAFVLCCALSFAMEATQTYLPKRYSALSDWLLNSLGGLCGAALAVALEALGAIDHWSRFRARWLAPDARGALVLLALWPFALLFPAAVPLGLGQVMERLEAALAQALNSTPFLDWMPVRDIELQPLVPLAELVCVALGLLVPCLLGYAVISARGRRLAFLATLCAMALAVSGLSAVLSWGPAHIWAWLTLAVQVGLGTGLLACLLALWGSARQCMALLLVAVGTQLALLNQAPASAYFAQTLQVWEQGRFIHFYGLAQWLGWVWPYAAGLYALLRLVRYPKP
jgi:VanZ family protein